MGSYPSKNKSNQILSESIRASEKLILLRSTKLNKCPLLLVSLFQRQKLGTGPFGIVERTGSLSLGMSEFKNWSHSLKTMPGANFVTYLSLNFLLSTRRIITPASKGYLRTK